MNAIIDALLEAGSHAVALLGAGGIGKTTVSLDVLWNHRVLESPFKWRCFAECDGATTIPLLLGRIATTLGVEVDLGTKQRNVEGISDVPDVNVQLRERILQVLRSHPTVICLDNFETPWEDPSIRIDVEKLLRDIVHIPTVAVLITMRGTQAPTDVDWSLRYTLRPLSDAYSSQLFEKISGTI